MFYVVNGIFGGPCADFLSAAKKSEKSVFYAENNAILIDRVGFVCYNLHD